jgi:hypothetical protein
MLLLCFNLNRNGKDDDEEDNDPEKKKMLEKLSGKKKIKNFVHKNVYSKSMKYKISFKISFLFHFGLWLVARVILFGKSQTNDIS